MTYGTAASRLFSVVSFVRPMNKNEKRITLVRRVNDMNAVTKSSGWRFGWFHLGDPYTLKSRGVFYSPGLTFVFFLFFRCREMI